TGFSSFTQDVNTRIIKRNSSGGSAWSLTNAGSQVAAVGSVAKRSGLSGFSQFAQASAHSCATAVSSPTPSSQSVCNNASIGSITASNTDGTGTFNYQWFSNTTN